MSTTPTPIDEELAAYVAAHAGGRDDVLLAVERETAELGSLANMQTSPEQAALLELLARATGARRAIEIGTFTGYGAIRIARGLGADGSLLCCELEPRWADVARRNLDRAGVGERVEIRVAPALETLRSLPAQPGFDLAYLDADKSGYPAYYDELVPRLRPGGLLAIDNVLMRGRVRDPAPDDEGARAVAELNDGIPRDDRVESVMLGMADGLTLVRRVP
ncbi:MAG TPA: O-methyltransferase [Thermoleophilaceae bacterium]|nr:O-methyltransferase [Thermoleophilaceae bacterium]